MCVKKNLILIILSDLVRVRLPWKLICFQLIEETIFDTILSFKVHNYTHQEMPVKYLSWGLICLLSSSVQALEYEIQLENESVSVARVKIMPHEEIGLHRDAYPQVVVALQGGVITRLESDGSTVDINFPTGRAVFREIDPPEQLHKSVNNSSTPVELIIIQLKK